VLDAGALRTSVQAPPVPGIYRLATTIHEPDGGAYDDATQELVPEITVQVSGPIAAHYDAPASIAGAPGSSLDVNVEITNIGSIAWTAPAPGSRAGEDDRSVAPGLAYRWVSLDGGPTPADGWLPYAANLAVGHHADIDLQVPAPRAVGRYQLVLDLATPLSGSLASSGVAPAVIAVTIAPLRAIGGV
jgi:hypothetical protein